MLFGALETVKISLIGIGAAVAADPATPPWTLTVQALSWRTTDYLAKN